jgi:uncharacterized membrane protein
VFLRLAGLRWPSLLFLMAAFFEFVFTLAQVQPANAVDQSRLTVDGMPLGGKVRTDSGIYKQYDCASSTQYREFTYCKRVKIETKVGGKLTTTTTIIHSGDGTVAYVNQFMEPASFTRADIDAEIARLSTKFGEKARLLEAPVQPGLPKAVIATWGSVKLVKLANADLDVLRSDKSPGKGILVDYLGDFTQSARAGFPVFSMQGDFGYIWIANYDEQGRGTLRFLAVNAATLTAAFAGPQTEQPRQPSSTGVIATTNQKPAAQPAGPTLEQQLEQCGESCPDKPELDKLRRDTLAQLEQAKLDAEDADRFSAAIATEQALDTYISSCDTNKCAFLSQAKAARDALVSSRSNAAQADAEESQYRTARGDVKALKQYVAQCNVCAFASDAVSEINEQRSKGADDLFDVEVCNHEYLPVDVAFAGRPDPNSDMWTSEGWWTVNSGKCEKIAKLRKGNFYLTAHNERGVWSGDESDRKSYCTSNKAFTRILLQEGGDCLEGENTTLFGTKHFEGSGSKFTWKIDAKPWTFTALAYSPSDATFGWAPGYPTAEEASDRAIEFCSRRSSDCKLARWVREDGCLALASGTNYDGEVALGWGTGIGARTDAVDACYAVPARSCRIVRVPGSPPRTIAR